MAGKPGKPITVEQAIEIRQLHAQGIADDKIAYDVGTSVPTVNSIGKMDDEEFDTYIKAKQAGGKRGKSGATVTAASQVRKQSEREIVDRSRKDFDQVMDLGNYCVKYVIPLAKKFNVSPHDMIGKAIYHYLMFHEEYEEMKQNIDYLRRLNTGLVEILHVRAQYQRKVNNIVNLFNVLNTQGKEPPIMIYEAFLAAVDNKPFPKVNGGTYVEEIIR